MNSLWITLGAALILISALEATPARDDSSERFERNGRYRNNKKRAVTGARPYGLTDPYRPSNCPPCDQNCPNADVTGITDNIENILNEMANLKQNMRNVENINKMMIDMKEEVSRLNHETSDQIQQSLTAIVRSGGCLGGGNISQLTDSIMDALRDALHESTHPRGHSANPVTYDTILQNEREQSDILKEILSIVTSGGIPCKDSSRALTRRRGRITDISSPITLDDLSDMVRKLTEEVALIVDRRDGELKEELSKLVDILRKDIVQMTDKILERMDNVGGNPDRQSGDMDVIKESMTSSTKSKAESAVEKAMSMFKSHMKGRRSLCD